MPTCGTVQDACYRKARYRVLTNQGKPWRMRTEDCGPSTLDTWAPRRLSTSKAQWRGQSRRIRHPGSWAERRRACLLTVYLVTNEAGSMMNPHEDMAGEQEAIWHPGWLKREGWWSHDGPSLSTGRPGTWPTCRYARKGTLCGVTTCSRTSKHDVAMGLSASVPALTIVDDYVAEFLPLRLPPWEVSESASWSGWRRQEGCLTVITADNGPESRSAQDPGQWAYRRAAKLHTSLGLWRMFLPRASTRLRDEC